jgi:uncharacterized protein (TIGR02757 family)
VNASGSAWVIPCTMPRLPRIVLSKKRALALAPRLERLFEGTRPTDFSADPVQFPRRYSAPDDVEVAAVFASALAFGRVASFQPVIQRILDIADGFGGPAHWVDGLAAHKDNVLANLQYRWLRGADFALIANTLGRARREHGSLQALFRSQYKPDHPDIGPALQGFTDALRATALTFVTALPRGVKQSLSQPSGGSACKRWNMFLRWMVRRPAHSTDPDLGLWDISPSKLIIPLDTHVLRVSQMIGLTRRSDGSWRTAVEITDNLRRVDAKDPVRFDFALAHLGIDGRCHGRHVPAVCTPCPLAPVCRFGGSSTMG